MNRRLLCFALTGLLLSGLARTGAEEVDATPLAVLTSSSQAYPAVTCTSSDPLASGDTLQLAADAREQLAPLLQLGSNWRFPVHIHILTPDDPLTAKINREASAAFADDATMRIEAVVPSSDPDARAFIQRQFVTALLWEKFFAKTKTFDAHTKLDAVPVWLVEGLREWLNEDPEHTRAAIVRKAVQAGLAPKLSEITSWQTLSSERLMGLWQRAFSFYLVDSLIQPGKRRMYFQQWFNALSGPNPTTAQYLFPNEVGWQHELLAATQRSRDIVYTWDETVAELASAEVITLPADKPSDTKICTVETVATFPRNQRLIAAVQDKILDLTALELRAHSSWRPILELYRFGLSELVNNPNPEKAQALIQQAHLQRAAEMDNHQKLVDYMNWFEVTKDDPGATSSFRSYFSTAQEMEKIEADPKHPNPIRANLLQIEAEL